MSLPDINADSVAASKKREERAAFMRAYVIAIVRAGHDFDHMNDPAVNAQLARKAFDAIEAEAGKP